MDLATADALVVQGRIGQAQRILAESPSEQAPGLLELLNSDPEAYREQVINSDVYLAAGAGGTGRGTITSLSEILYVLGRRRLLVVGVVLILAGIALLFGLFREPVYVAEARVSVEPQGKLESEEARLAFLEEVRGAVVTQEMLDEVRRRAGWEAEPEGVLRTARPEDVRWTGTAVRGYRYGSPATSRGRRPGRPTPTRRCSSRGSMTSATGRSPTAYPSPRPRGAKGRAGRL